LTTVNSLQQECDECGFFGSCREVSNDGRPVLANAVVRPLMVTGADYDQLSTAFYQNVNKVLNDRESAQGAVLQVEKVATYIVRE
jgi:hypothetical protein